MDITEFKQVFEKHINHKEMNLIKFKPLISKTLNYIKKSFAKN